MVRVVLDACVLFPVILTDTLLSLAVEAYYQPIWTDQILSEAKKSVSLSLDKQKQLGVISRFQAMRIAFPDALITNHRSSWHLVPEEIPDWNDAHVIAAAIRAQAQLILTFNLKDFPSDILGPLGIAAVSPDQFLLGLATAMPIEVGNSLLKQVAKYQNPKISISDLLESLSNSAPNFTGFIRAANGWN